MSNLTWSWGVPSAVLEVWVRGALPVWRELAIEGASGVWGKKEQSCMECIPDVLWAYPPAGTQCCDLDTGGSVSTTLFLWLVFRDYAPWRSRWLCSTWAGHGPGQVTAGRICQQCRKPRAWLFYDPGAPTHQEAVGLSAVAVGIKGGGAWWPASLSGKVIPFLLAGSLWWHLWDHFSLPGGQALGLALLLLSKATGLPGFFPL